MSKETGQANKGWFGSSQSRLPCTLEKVLLSYTRRLLAIPDRSLFPMCFAKSAFFYAVCLLFFLIALVDPPCVASNGIALAGVRGSVPGAGCGLVGWESRLGLSQWNRMEYLQWIAHSQQGSQRLRGEFAVGQRFAFTADPGSFSGCWYQGSWLQQRDRHQRAPLREGFSFRRGSIGCWAPVGYLEWEWDRANPTEIDKEETELLGGSHHLTWGGVRLLRARLNGRVTRTRDRRWQCAARIQQRFLYQHTWRLGIELTGPKRHMRESADWRFTLGVQWKLGLDKRDPKAASTTVWSAMIADKLLSLH